MARTERLLSISMAVLAVFASLMLGMGQQDATRPLMMLAAAVVSVYFTDFKRVFWLNRTLANIAAVAAVALSLYDFAHFDQDHQLLAIANLLIYLQIVVLFQQKSVRVFWQLAMLSLLQVVVAAALNFSVVFGVLLVGYLFLTLAALSLFFVYREMLAYAAEAPSNGRPAFFSNSAAPAVMQPARSVNELDAIAPRMRLGRLCAQMGGVTLLVTVVLFFAVPRFGNSAWRSAPLAGRTVGFSQKVTLGELGEVVENPAMVMRLQLVDQRTGQPLKLQGEPLLRGSVVTTYAHQQWSQSRSRGGEKIELPVAPSRRRLVRQIITLEPLDEPVVFALHPAYRLYEDCLVRYDTSRKQLVRPRRYQDKQSNFELLTDGIERGRQHPFTVLHDPLNFYQYAQLLQLPTAVNDDGPDLLSGLKRVAREVVEKAQVPDRDHYRIAQALNAFLQSGGGFRYSLNGPRRDRELDAVEDFVVNHRVGHCEYFASALVLMLRSQGVPARLVLGYKGGEYNELGNFYQVRQLHAHAWVEAYLGAEMLEGRDFARGTPAPYGGWLRLDPTTDSAADGSISATTGMLASLGQLFDYVEMLWVTRVVGMNADQQQRAVYDPLSQSVSQLVEQLRGDGEPRSLWSRLTVVAQALWRWTQGNWFSWQGGLAAMCVSLVAVVLYRLVMLALRRLYALLTRRRRRAVPTRVEFYQRLENLLARHGYLRPPGQTPREFAVATGGQLSETLALRPAAPLPRQLVDAFYRVRFGHEELAPTEAEQIGQMLDQLERLLAAPQ